MKPRLLSSARLSFSLATAIAAMFVAPSTQAANITWSGATNTWNTNTNWVGSVLPVNNDSLFFGTAGAGGLTLNNDLTSGSFTVASLIFNSTAGAYVIGDGTATANAGNTFVLGAPAATAAFTSSITNGSGNVQTINTPFSVTAVRNVIGGADISLAGNISGAAGGIRKSSSNTLTLSGTNTYTGVTQVDIGVLRLDSANAVPGGIGASGGLSNINLNGGVLGLATGDFTRSLNNTTSTVQFGGNGGWAAFGTNRVVNLGGASASVNWTTANTGLNSKVLILSHPTATHTVDFQNPLDMLAVARTVQVDEGAAAIDAIISGNITGIASGNLTKTGNGTLVLSGAVNNYVGTTAVNAGTLLINGTKSGTGTVTVSNATNFGAALGGTGTINGAVTVSATGRLDLTDGAVANLSLGSSLTLSGTSGTPNLLFFDLGNGAGGTDKIITTGAHTAGTANGVQVHLNQLSGTAINPGTYTLIQGGAASTFTGYVLATERAGRNLYSALGASTNNLQVTVAAGAPGPADSFTYWRGETESDWDIAPWYSDAAGTVTSAMPGYSSNVRFATANVNNLSTNLFTDFEINSLTVDAGLTGPISIATKMLTIDATTDNGNTLGNGITANNELGTTISSQVGLANSQTWTVGTGAALTVSGVVSDFGMAHSLAKAGAGTLTLNGVNTFSGPLTVSGGTLAVGGAGQLNNGSYGANIVTNGTLSYNSSAAQTLAGIISGTGSLTKSAGSTLTLNNSGTFTGGASISGGTLSIGTANLVNPLGSGTTTVNTGGTYALSATTISAPLVLNGGTVTAGNSFSSYINGPTTLDANSTISVSGNLTVFGNISGVGGLTKTLAAFVSLSGTNTYDGPTIINAGGFTIKSSLYGNDDTKWIPTNITVASGAALVLNVGGAGEFTIAQAGTMFSQLGGAVNNNGLLAGSQFGVDTRTSGGNFIIPDNLIDSSGPGGGAVGFRYVGNGTTGGSTLELTGNNTYSGLTIVDRAGTIKVSSINSVDIADLDPGLPLATSSLGRPTTVANGTIQLGSNASFVGGNLTYTGTGETTDRVVNLGGANGSVYTFDQSGTGLLKFTSNFTMTDLRGTQTIELKGSTAGTGEMACVLPAGDGALPNRLTKSGSGTWTLTGANLLGGITTLNAGVLSVSTISDGGTSGQATTTAGNATVNLTTGTTAGMTVGMTVVSTAIPIGRTVASIVNSTQFTLNSGTGVGAATARGLTIGTPSNLGIAPGVAANLVFNGGTLQYTGATATTNRSFTINAGKVATFDITTNNLTITGASTATTGALTKTGNGTLTLAGTNLHTGATTVSAGTLSLGSGGSVATSASVAIAAGATFDTSGQAIYAIPTGKPVVFGIDATGSGSSGKITAAQLNIANATVTYNINGTPDDPVYVLATYTTLTGGAFLSVPTPPVGYNLDYAYQGNKIALVSAGTPYDTWKAGPFTNAFSNTLPGVDFDNDGLSNLLEFVLGGDPTISQAGIAPTVSVSGGNLVMTFKRSDASELAPAVSVKVELSTDLTFSTPADDITIGPVTDAGPIAPSGASYTVANSGGFDTIVLTIPQGAAPKKFARVKAVQP